MVAADYSSHRVVGSALGFDDHIGFAEPVGAGNHTMTVV